MDPNQSQHNPFSLLTDYKGNIRELCDVKIQGTLPILPVRGMVLFPGVIAPIAVGRESSLALVRQALEREGEAYIGISTQVDAAIEQPSLQDLYPTGTLARVLRLIELPTHTTAIVQTYGRIAIDPRPTRVNPYLRARVQSLEEVFPAEDDNEFAALYETFRETAFDYVRKNEHLGAEALFAIQSITQPLFFIHLVATNLPFDTEEKALLLEEGDVKLRTYRLLQILQREVQYLDLKLNIQKKTHEELNQQQKEYFLHQQLKNIQSELGESENNGELHDLRTRAEATPMSEAVRKIFAKELQKLERTNPHNPDYAVSINYLETVLSLPWGKSTTDQLDMRQAQRLLDKDHYGMEKVKERILEHLAMMRVRTSGKPSILCLYGPPGVGKTSLCRSIAESLGRKYVRMSLGGLHDESEIRGHRRTYIAAMCGRVMKSLIKAESNNPLFVLDEIDKVGGASHSGDPQSALLELLDPEQNSSFHDNYLDFDYDLSQVFFVATANNLASIPAPLRDRMELIEVEGYLTEEKKEIARRHLIPNEVRGLELPYELKLSPSGTEYLIEQYTRESGVRQLEKQIAKLVRKVVLQTQMGAIAAPLHALKPADVQRIMGTPPYNRDRYQGNDYAGVVTGLAWTAVGGEILFIESSVSRSKSPRLVITGNLGEVMKESAMLALEYVKSHAETLAIDYRIFDHWNLHIHVPEGATPKDGPSAGITIATAIASLLTQRKVRPHIAMTGEITLRGRVLPVGGIKEKILAAKRAGVTDIVLSVDNRKDVADIPQRYVAGLTFHHVQTVDEVWKFALLDEQVSDAIDLSAPFSLEA
ncbi:MAG: endopeptidase La [Bacteroidales bacterium]|nr:endopeptidase La [Bacteroidales bacterium]